MKRENAIPFTRRDLVDDLAQRIEDLGARNAFLRLCRGIENHYHFRLHGELEALKANYAPLDPDATSLPVPRSGPASVSAARSTSAADLTESGIRRILNAANYREITKEQIQQALGAASPWGLQIDVDLEDYERLVLFSRGEYPECTEKKALFFKRRYDYTVYSNVALAFQLKDGFRTGSAFAGKSQVKYRTDKLYLKLFKNVPTVDLEMLFPDTDIKIRVFDKLKVIVPLAVGALSSLYKLISYMLGHGQSGLLWTQVGFWAVMGGLFGAAIKGFSSYRNTVEKYLRSLTESLYFQNLDNNSGVFKYLLDDAEEEECKEAILGYYFLAFRAPGAGSAAALDEEVERYFREDLGADVDFEIEDSLKKLRELGLLVEEGISFSAKPLDQALEHLERLWKGMTLGLPPA